MRTLHFLPLLGLAGLLGCGDKDNAGAGDADADTDTDTDTDVPATACDLETSGMICAWVGVEGQPFFGPDGELASESAVYLPLDMTWGPDGKPYFIDWNNHRVRTVEADGTVTTVMGSGIIGDGYFDTETGLWSDGPALGFKINHPSDLAFNAHDPDAMYVAAWHNSRIERLDHTSGELEYYAGTGARSFGGDGSDMATALLDLPSSVVFDDAGNMYISDQANQVIRRIDGATNVITTVAGILKAPTYNGDGLDALATNFSATTGQSADPSNKMTFHEGSIFFVDTESNLVRRFDLDTNLIHVVAGVYEPDPVMVDTNGDYVGDLTVGLGGYAGDGGPALAARLNKPRDLAIDADGTIYVADTNNHCVRVITPDGLIDTFAGTCGEAHIGLPGVPSMADEVAATDAKLQKPFGVAIDPSTGDVYIADTWNHVFRVVYK